MTTACSSPGSSCRSRTGAGWMRRLLPASQRRLLATWLLTVASPITSRAADPAAVPVCPPDPAPRAACAPIPFPTPVVGLYGVPAVACSLVAAAGFNVVQSYDFESERQPDVDAWLGIARPYLDKAQKHGVRVLLGVPRNWLRQRLASPVCAAVRGLRDHPALLAWYEDEIAQGGDLGAVELMQRIVAAEDPAHGFVLEEGKDVPALRDWGRMRMFTYYPVTASARDRGRVQTLRQRFPVANLRTPFMPALQAYGRDLVRGYPNRDLVAPTRTEMGFTLASALIGGARGVFVYTYLHSTRYDTARLASKQWPYVDARPLSEVSPSVWASALQCAAQARLLLSLLATARPDPSVAVAAPQGVESAAWQVQEGTLVVLANPDYKTRLAIVTLPAGAARVQRLDGAEWVAAPPASAGRLEVQLQGPGSAVLLVGASTP